MGRSESAEFVVVGSGAGGATVAATLAERGHDVLVLEEGEHRTRPDFGRPAYGMFRDLFRDFGAQAASSRTVIPFLEGRCVGGTTVVSGAIFHRLPRETFDAWALDDAMTHALSYEEIDRAASEIEALLDARANLQPLLRDLPAARVLDGLGWEYRAMRRAAPGCQASGRCMQGCPSGGKLSMEASFIPRAVRAGARVRARHRVDAIVARRGRAERLIVRDVATHESLSIVAERGIFVCAGALQSPRLLQRSGLARDLPHVGKHLQCHPGVGVLGLLSERAVDVVGPPQGIEILEFMHDGIKLATQLVPIELALGRAPRSGHALATLLSRHEQLSSWTCSVRSDSEGSVSEGIFGGRIHYQPSALDMQRVRRGVAALARLLEALGARSIFPGVHGVPVELERAAPFDDASAWPTDARSYPLSVGHMFGTCRMGSNPSTSVVGTDFRVHGLSNLFVADASVFPTNTGVNPQLSIMSLARVAARRALA